MSLCLQPQPHGSRHPGGGGERHEPSPWAALPGSHAGVFLAVGASAGAMTRQHVQAEGRRPGALKASPGSGSSPASSTSADIEYGDLERRLPPSAGRWDSRGSHVPTPGPTACRPARGIVFVKQGIVWREEQNAIYEAVGAGGSRTSTPEAVRRAACYSAPHVRGLAGAAPPAAGWVSGAPGRWKPRRAGTRRIGEIAEAIVDGLRWSSGTGTVDLRPRNDQHRLRPRHRRRDASLQRS